MSATLTENRKKVPTGVVTLLFTDIEGSSRLWEQHGDAFIPVWQAHDALMRHAINRFDGFEVKNEGDAFMVAFSDAKTAVHCSIFMQVVLARYPWPSDIGATRVRMGLHTGEPFVQANDYFGPTVNRAAYICSAAHGGQILLSEETFRAAESRFDPKIAFEDLGERRLKDMGMPHRLFHATHPSVTQPRFAPPITLDASPNNLPVQRTSFVGRTEQIGRIAGFLASGEKPLLTVTGPKGIGKTRLTLQAAANVAEWFPDGVWYVKLESASDVTGAAVEIASALHLPLHGDASPLTEVREWLANRRCLLILDDVNAVPQASRLLRELLSGATNLRCLATAGGSLEIEEASELPLEGLPILPVPPLPAWRPSIPEIPARAGLGETEAGRLFMDRASEAHPDLRLSEKERSAAGQLLRRLEGIPASVERAAEMLNRVPPSAINTWLDQTSQSLKASEGVAKFRNLVRKGAQQVTSVVEGAARSSSAGLGNLAQSIANAATDRSELETATQMGRESLRLSKEAGNSLGMADALRQLARTKWMAGERRMAANMLGAAVEIYRTQQPEVAPIAERELEMYEAQLREAGDASMVRVSVDTAVSMALKDNPSIS